MTLRGATNTFPPKRNLQYPNLGGVLPITDCEHKAQQLAHQAISQSTQQQAAEKSPGRTHPASRLLRAASVLADGTRSVGYLLCCGVLQLSCGYCDPISSACGGRNLLVRSTQSLVMRRTSAHGKPRGSHHRTAAGQPRLMNRGLGFPLCSAALVWLLPSDLLGMSRHTQKPCSHVRVDFRFVLFFCWVCAISRFPFRSMIPHFFFFFCQLQSYWSPSCDRVQQSSAAEFEDIQNALQRKCPRSSYLEA